MLKAILVMILHSMATIEISKVPAFFRSTIYRF